MKRRSFQRYLWPSIFLGLIPFLLFRLVIFYEVTFPIGSYVKFPGVFNIDNPQLRPQSRSNVVGGSDVGLAAPRVSKNADPEENSLLRDKNSLGHFQDQRQTATEAFGQKEDEGVRKPNSEDSIQIPSNLDSLGVRTKNSVSELSRKARDAKEVTATLNDAESESRSIEDGNLAVEKFGMVTEELDRKEKNHRKRADEEAQNSEEEDRKRTKDEVFHQEENERGQKRQQEEELMQKRQQEEEELKQKFQQEEELKQKRQQEEEELKQKRQQEEEKLKQKGEEERMRREEEERKLKEEQEERKLKEEQEEERKLKKEQEEERKLEEKVEEERELKKKEEERKLKEDEDRKLEEKEQRKIKEEGKEVKENEGRTVHEEREQEIQDKEMGDSEARKEEGNLRTEEKSEQRFQVNYIPEVITDAQTGEDRNGNRDPVQLVEGESNVENAAGHTSDERKAKGDNEDDTDSQDENNDEKQEGRVPAEVVINPEEMLTRLWENRPGDCNLHDGAWEYDEAEPLYTNETCAYIQGDQDCLANGRPDRMYLHLRWRPRDCDLPRFDAEAFMKAFKGKSIGFVGDSLARNQMQSLLCMLAQVEEPTLLYDYNANLKWIYEQHQVIIIVVWSPYLLNYSTEALEGYDLPSVLHLDVLDTLWTSKIKELDIIVLSIGQWYFKPAVYVRNGEVVGCHYCPGLNLTDISFYDVYRDALRQVLDKVASEMKGIVIMSTFAIQHFENGPWEKGGDCRRERPAEPEDMPLFGGLHNEMRAVVLDAFTHTLNSRSQGDRGLYFDFLDVTQVSLLRADGHPGPYRRPFPYAHKDPSEWIQNDCLHWCLPGPVDTWNQLLVNIAHRYL